MISCTLVFRMRYFEWQAVLLTVGQEIEEKLSEAAFKTVVNPERTPVCQSYLDTGRPGCVMEGVKG